MLGDAIERKQAARSTAAAFRSRMRPEIAAGGFARDDSTIEFFTRINALLEPQMTVIDLGAGRGSIFQRGSTKYSVRLRKLQGKVAKVIGIDVDQAIAEHPHLDERHVVGVNDPYPLETASVDLIVCDWVLEHVANPENFVAEIARVLKPGGWFCARTPNRWSYIGIAIGLLPEALHDKVLARVNPDRQEADIFPTVYKMNTMGRIRQYFPPAGWENLSYLVNPMPRYHGNSSVLFRLIDLYQSLMPAGLKTEILVFNRKRA